MLRIASARRAAQLIAAAVGIAVAFLFIRHFSALTPEQLMTTLFDVSAPTRYAFVSDEDSARVAVVDLLEQRQVTTLELQAQPDFWALSAAHGKLLYAENGGDEVFIRDVVSHDNKRVRLSHPVNVWQYNDTHHWLFIGGNGILSRVDIVSGDIESINTSIERFDGLLYDAFLQKVWVIDSKREELVSWVLTEGDQASALQCYSLPHGARDFAPLSVTPDGLYLILGFARDDQAYQVELWNLTTNSWVDSVFDMENSPIVRPYAGARGRYIWAFTQSGSGIRIDASPPYLLKRIDSEIGQVSVIATGWLDQRLLIAGDTAVAVYDTESLNLVDTVALPDAVRDLFITADSKTALLTVNDTPTLYAVSLRDARLASVPLTELSKPNKVIMGASATLCH